MGFEEYVSAAWPRLLRSAWLLTGDWHRAEDLVQTVLARAYGRWSRIGGDAPDAYLRTMLATTYLSWRRRRWRGEVPAATVPDRMSPDPADGTEVRQVLAAALSRLPHQQRGATLDLSAPLGDRVLRDGYDHRRPRLYRDRELPLLTEHGWEEVPGSLAMAADGNSWSTAYTRPGGPDISIEVGPTAIRRPDSPAAGTAAMGERTGIIYPHPGMQSYEIRWTVDDLTYSLTAFPTEGDTMTLDQFRSLIRALEWA